MEGVWRKHGGLEWESMEGVWREYGGREWASMQVNMTLITIHTLQYIHCGGLSDFIVCSQAQCCTPMGSPILL